MRLIVLVLLLGFFSQAAQAVTIGPAQTKNERNRRDPSFASAPQATARGYEEVLKKFLEEDFTQSERLASRYLTRAKRPDERADQTAYLRALSLMKLGRYAEARPLLKELENEAVSPVLRAQAAYSLGDSFYFENKRAEADIYYKEAVTRYPAHGEAPGVKRLLGLSVTGPGPELSKRDTLENANVSLLHRDSAFGTRSGSAQQFAVEEGVLYSVQVGAFARRRNAERLLNKLLRNRYDAYISREEEAGHFRVRVGHMTAEEEARSLESRLKKDGYPTRIFP